jgi:hypothetical protein
MGGDRSLGSIMLAFLFLALPAFGWMLYKGIFATVFTITFGLPNTPFNLIFGITFLTLITTAIGIMVSVFVLVFVLSSVSANILGVGFKGISDGISKMILQWSFVLIFLTLFALVTGQAMSSFPYNFGLLYTIFFEMLGIVGLVLRFIA